MVGFKDSYMTPQDKYDSMKEKEGRRCGICPKSSSLIRGRPTSFSGILDYFG